MANRYDAVGVEAEFEPGSRGRVQKNLLGIRSVREMDQAESEALIRVTEEAFDRYTEDHRFVADDICTIHRLWLGDIYEWAGRYRTVNLFKDGFPFAPATEVPRLMREFETGPLRESTPCRNPGDRFDRLPRPIAVVHAELVLIHPFRDGNGRCARLLASLMALQLGLPPLDFGGIRGKK